jgi:hypothetical protein
MFEWTIIPSVANSDGRRSGLLEASLGDVLYDLFFDP